MNITLATRVATYRLILPRRLSGVKKAVSYFSYKQHTLHHFSCVITIHAFSRPHTITFSAPFYKLSDTICAVIARYLLASRSHYGRLLRRHKNILGCSYRASSVRIAIRLPKDATVYFLFFPLHVSGSHKPIIRGISRCSLYTTIWFMWCLCCSSACACGLVCRGGLTVQ